MSEPVWTKTPPTAPGWYWWRLPYTEPEVVFVLTAFKFPPQLFKRSEWREYHRMADYPSAEWWPEPIPKPPWVKS